VNTVTASEGHGAQAIAEAAEKRWTLIVVAIIGLIIGMMIVTGLHWAAMPPSRVETIDVNTLHIKGEFVESNLGTALEGDGAVIVRVLAQQYSFQPQCLVVPVDMPVTFRGTSSDAIHGFSVGSSNANTMLIPGFVATFTTTFRHTGEHLMPCHEYCGTGHEAMWARVQVISQQDFLTRSRNEKRLSCVRS
jgi:cytochrome c oxidase subunit II